MDLHLQFVLNLPKIPDLKLQAHKLCSWLQQNAAADCVLALDEVIHLAMQGHQPAREALNPFMLTLGILELLDDLERRKLYETAFTCGVPVVSCMFLNDPPLREAPPKEAFKIVDVRDEVQPQPTTAEGKRDPITLGERRSLAKTQNPQILEKLLTDPDPLVAQNLLDNPAVKERLVVRLASQRPIQEEILLLIGCHPRWGQKQQIRRTLAFNPYAPPALSCLTILTISKKDLREIRSTETLHPRVRSLAQILLSLRIQ